MVANGWDLTEKGWRKVLIFSSFTELSRFLAALAPEADVRDHHPDLRVFRASRLEIHLITHDAESVTDKDEELAFLIDELASNFSLIPG